MEAEQGLARAPKTVAEPAQALRNAAVSVFFRGSYRKVLATVIAAGATLQEAEDAVSDAMQAVLQAWGRIESPLAYARRAGSGASTRSGSVAGRTSRSASTCCPTTTAALTPP